MKPQQKNLNILLILILICFPQISKCGDCTACTTTDVLVCSDPTGTQCDSNCKPRYDTNQCYDCGSSSVGYYTIISQDSVYVCQLGCQGNKIIGDTGECTDQPITTHVYQLGNVYFFSGDPSTDDKLKRVSGNLYECKSYHIKENINGKEVYTCHDLDSIISQLPSSATYYFDSTKGELLQTGCPNGLNKKKKINPTNPGDPGPTIIRCSESCEPGEFYQKVYNGGTNEESCIGICDGSVTSDYIYTYVDNGVKKCLNACPPGTYIKGGNTCVNLDQCDYYIPDYNTCYDSCPEGGSLTDKKYHNYGSKICIDSCSGEYAYENDKVCYKKEDCQFIDESTNPKGCLPSCGPTQYHDYNSKSCISRCGDTNPNNKFHAIDDNVCYPSCASIPGNYIYEKSDLSCMTPAQKISNPSYCQYYYIKIDGVRKCTDSTDVCVNAGYKFIDFTNNICKESCDNGYYQMEVQAPTSGGTFTKDFVKCYEDLNKALSDSDVKFYKIKTKQCWSENSLPNNPDIFINGESSIGSRKYEIVDECENYYYEDTSDNNRQHCIGNCGSSPCPSALKYYSKGSKQCVGSCTTLSKNYYDRDTNECLDTCKGNSNYGFQIDIDTSNPAPLACLSSCTGMKSFYNYDSNICLSFCGEDNSNKKYHADGKFVCYPSCKEIPGEYIYEGVPDSTDNIITCYKTKDNSVCTYFYEKVNGIRICATSLEKCYYANYKYIMENGECKDNCDGYYQLEHSFTPVGGTVPLIVYKCYEKLVTLIGSLNLGTNEKLYCDKQIKKCWIKESLIDGYYIKSILPEASPSDNKFEIVKECPNFYYEDSTNGNTCIDSCKSTAPSLNYYFVNGNKQCISSLTSCKNFNKYYYDPTTNECLDTCRGRIDHGFQDNVDTSKVQECLRSCDVTSRTKKYYNIDSNICLTYCGEDGSNKKYHAYGKNACYSSCKDIPGEDYIYEVKDTNDYTCYKSSDYSTISSNCRFYYLKNGETKVCQTVDKCKSMNNIYLIGNQCTDKCDGYFKFETTKSITVGSTTTSTTFFECYANQDDFYNHINPSGTTNNIYYNINLKKLWDDWNEVPNGYFITKDDNSHKYEVVDECEHFYYKKTVDSVDYCYCTSKCKIITSTGVTTGLFFVNGRKNCESSCTEFNLNKLYYNPVTNECLETCKGLPGKEFADKIDTTSTTQPCKDSCGTNYHDFGSNICFTTCGNGDINKLYRIDEDIYTTDVNKYICFSSCSEIPGGEYKYELNKKCYKSSTDVPSDTCEYYYIKANGEKQCSNLNTCVNTMKYKYVVNKECRESCDGYYKLETEESSITYIKCYDSISDVLSINVEVYYNIKSKLCWKKYPSGYYILKQDASTPQKYEVVDECEHYYYSQSFSVAGSDPQIKYYCTKTCKPIATEGVTSLETTTATTQYFVKGKKNCETKCDLLNKYYYNPENNECLDTCKGLPGKEFAELDSNPIYKCIDSCSSSSNNYYDYDSNICLNSCGSGNSNYLYHANGDKICYPSCKDIPGGGYKYELKEGTGLSIVCYKTQSTLPPDTCKYFYLKEDGILKCLTYTDECEDMKFKFILGNECTNDCGDYFILEDELFSDRNPTSGTSTYKFKKCYTKNNCPINTDGGVSESYYNTKEKKCWKNYPIGYYINSIASPYEVVNECEMFYYSEKIPIPGTDPQEYYDKYYCTDKCKSITSIGSTTFSNGLFFNNGIKKCESSCTAFSKYYYDPSTNECLSTCIGLEGKEFSDEINFESTDPAPQPTACKRNCDGKFYNYGTKICIDNCATKFKKQGTSENICYNSCSEIPGNAYIYEDIYEEISTSGPGTICYSKSEINSNSASCPYYYSKGDGTMKCVGSVQVCLDMNNGFDYLYDKECRKSCEDKYKYMDYSISDTTPIIMCFDSLVDALKRSTGVKYYDATQKKCWKDYPKVSDTGIDNYYFIKNKITSGSNDYYEVVENCEYFYYEVEITGINHKYCINDCKEKNLFFNEGDKKCVDCEYYDPSNRQCWQTCKEHPNLKYSYKYSDTSPPQPCIEKCPKYFKEETATLKEHYFCIDEYNNDGTFIDVKNNQILPGCGAKHYTVGNKCYPKCDVDNGYIYINTDTYDCLLACPTGLKNLQPLENTNVYLCESNCEPNQYRLGDKCLSKCPKNFNFIGNNNICKQSCDDEASNKRYIPYEKINKADGSYDYTVYKCVYKCDDENAKDVDNNVYLKYTETKPNECRQSCDTNLINDHPFYLDSKPNECIAKCPPNLPYYKQDSTIPGYKCLDSICTDPNTFFLDGECKTGKEDCKNAGKIYLGSIYDTNIGSSSTVNNYNICLDKCKDNEIKMNQNDGTYICLRQCLYYIYFANEEDKYECVKDCPLGKPFIGKDNICKTSCSEEDGINYYEIEDKSSGISYPIYRCIPGCGGEYYLQLSNGGFQCYKECPNTQQYNFPYISVEENKCYDDCSKSNINSFTLITEGTPPEKKCVKNCPTSATDSKKYYGEDKICVENCNGFTDTKLIDQNNKCVAKCDITSTYKFELYGECVKECDPVTSSFTPSVTGKNLIRYLKGEYKCKEKCLEPENIINGRECVSTCDGFLDKLSTGEYACLTSCSKSSTNKLYYDFNNKKICVENCETNDKIVQPINRCIDACDKLNDDTITYYYYLDPSNIEYCVLNCPITKPYVNDNNECTDQCPVDKKYYIKEFTHSENVHTRKCLSDCPREYPFYTKTTDNYPCEGSCSGYIVPNDDTRIIGQECISTCPDGDYKFKIENLAQNIKKCYKVCPEGYKYHFNDDTGDSNNNIKYNNDKSCFKECPEDSPFHKRGELICRSETELSGGIILYDEKEWISSTINADIRQCPQNYELRTKIIGAPSTDPIIVCSHECIEKYGQYKSHYNTCEKNCNPTTSAENSISLVVGKNLINDENSKTCICKNKFYVNDQNLEKTCFSEATGDCKDITSISGYKIPLVGTKQCLKKCDNDRILSPSGDKCYDSKYSCADFANTKLVVKDDGQKQCDCMFKFYWDNDDNTGNKHCLEENALCPESHSLYIPDTMQCVRTCPSDYIYTFKNFCLNQCPRGSTINEATHTCECKDSGGNDKFWYQVTKGNYECLQGDCIDEYPLYAESTKECLKTCKGSYYPILFEKKCYDNCGSATTGIENLSKKDITNSDLANQICYCQRPWYYEANNKMHCPAEDAGITRCQKYKEIQNLDLDYMIKETKQCVKECPSEFHYDFNYECFTSCEEVDTKYLYHVQKQDTSFHCDCQNLWHLDPTDEYEKNKICFSEDVVECPAVGDPSTSYLIFDKKQCVDSVNECSSSSFKFNNICYEKCPEHTITDTDETLGNICTCNKDEGLWFEYNRFGNTHYKCGLESCPQSVVIGQDEFIVKNLLEKEKQCVTTCSIDDEYKLSFRNICSKECPKLTYENDIEDECLFYDITDTDKITNLEELKEAANIQAKELYEKTGHQSGYLLNKYDASLQIYGLNRLKDNKQLTMISNLTYIELGECLNRIYEDYNLTDNDVILVAKYDLLTRNQKTSSSPENNENPASPETPAEPATPPGQDNNGNTPQTSRDSRFLINQVEYEFFLSRTMEKIEGSVCKPYDILISYPIVFNLKKFDNYEDGINYNDYLKKFNIGKELNSKNPKIDTFNKDNDVYKDICIGVEINGKDLVLEDRYDYLYPNNISLCESNCTMKNTDFELNRINCLCTYKEIFDFNRIDEDNNDILNDPNFEKTKQSGANAQIIKCLSKLDVEYAIVKNEAFYFSAVISAVEISMVLISAISGIKGIVTFMQGLLNIGNQANIVNTANKLINNPPKKENSNINDEKEDEIDKNEGNKKNIVIKKRIVLNNNRNNGNNMTNSDNNTEGDNLEDKDINYGITIKSGINNIKTNKSISEIDYNNNYNTNYINMNAEFIPPEYAFKFFKSNDKGVVKKIERSKIPFNVNKSTKILLDYKNNINYDQNYLQGPYYEDQNIIEIVDDVNIYNNKTKTIKFNENNNINNINNENSIIYKKSGKNTMNDFNMNRKRNIANHNNYINSNNNKLNIISDEKDFITIKKINPINKPQSNIVVEDYQEEEVKKYDDMTSLYNLMKREHTYLRASFEKYISKSHPNILSIFLAEILDKIYFIKIFIFLKKFEMISIHISLYMLYHILLLSLLCGFFTVTTIKKIWEDSNYPTMNYYMLFGFISNIIIWIIYRIFILLLDNQDRIRILVRLNNEMKMKEKNEENNENENSQEKINKKYEELMRTIKIQTLVFYIISFIITAFCFIYLVSFFAIYTGTKGKVLKAYYISIIEIILIKFIYGLCLASLRIAAEGNELKSLYKFAYVCDKYLS